MMWRMLIPVLFIFNSNPPKLIKWTAVADYPSLWVEHCTLINKVLISLILNYANE